MQNESATLRSSLAFLIKLNTHLACCIATAILVISPREMKLIFMEKSVPDILKALFAI